MAKGLNSALLVLGTSGLLGVLLDLDHIVSFLVWGRMDRSAHISGFIVTYVVCFLGGACLLGLLCKGLVKKWRGTDIS